MYQGVSDKIRDLIEREVLWEQHLVPDRELARLFGVKGGTSCTSF